MVIFDLDGILVDTGAVALCDNLKELSEIIARL